MGQISLDITDRKRAEIATGRLAAIVASTDDAVIGKTLDGCGHELERSGGADLRLQRRGGDRPAHQLPAPAGSGRRDRHDPRAPERRGRAWSTRDGPPAQGRARRRRVADRLPGARRRRCDRRRVDGRARHHRAEGDRRAAGGLRGAAAYDDRARPDRDRDDSLDGRLLQVNPALCQMPATASRTARPRLPDDHPSRRRRRERQRRWNG